MEMILQRITELNKIIIKRMEVMSDHIHLLIRFKPKYAPTNIVKSFKGGSARMFFSRDTQKLSYKNFGGGNLWSPRYYMSTLGNMSKDVVERYIENQKKRLAALILGHFHLK